MTRFALFVTAAVLMPAAVADAAASLTRTEARRAALRASAQTCGAVPWCDGYGVVSAQRCRRGADGAVMCPMWFLTARDDRCGGLVTIKRGRAGRLDVGMAVPMDCAAGNGSTGTG
jgi:hypothetical protein